VRFKVVKERRQHNSECPEGFLAIQHRIACVEQLVGCLDGFGLNMIKACVIIVVLEGLVMEPVIECNKDDFIFLLCVFGVQDAEGVKICRKKSRTSRALRMAPMLPRNALWVTVEGQDVQDKSEKMSHVMELMSQLTLHERKGTPFDFGSKDSTTTGNAGQCVKQADQVGDRSHDKTNHQPLTAVECHRGIGAKEFFPSTSSFRLNQIFESGT
jgi:hypothetical protein